jgi:hypothetical protein
MAQDTCAQDNYQPAPPDTATCPHCGATVPSLDPAAPFVRLANLCYRCLDCARNWSEVRGPHGAERFWDVEAPA